MRRAFGGLWWVVACSITTTVCAQPSAASHETYEDTRVEAALREAGMEIDAAPQGKSIAFIRLVRHDVFVPEEPWPEWPNIFHTQTRAAVIEREYLFSVGQRFDQALLEETERNLRSMGIFSLVRIVAVKTNEPNAIGLLVHTRDLWSLRLEQDFQVTGSVLDRLLLQGTERNLAGHNKALVARFQMNPITFSVGQVYIDRRMFLGQHRLDQLFDVFFNRRSGEIEGSQGQVTVSKPFYSLAQQLSYKLEAQYITKIARVVRTGRVASYDNPETDEIEAIPRVWDDRSGAIEINTGHRFGERFKHLITLGAGYRDRSVQPNAQTHLPDAARAAFRRDVLPRVRREVFPSMSLEVFEARFVAFRDLGSFGQTEAVRVGPWAQLGATLPLSVWGSSTDSVALALNAGYVVSLDGSLFDSSVSITGRYENGVLINQRLALLGRGATPMSDYGRFVMRWNWELRRRDKDNTAVTLGGDNGLRGFASQALIGFGASRFLGNLEYRTPPLVWQSAHIGLVAFYDAGTVYEKLSTVRMHHSLGAGLRVLFPQFNRYVFRVDLGAPLNESGFSVVASFGSSQAVPLTAAEDEQINTAY